MLHPSEHKPDLVYHCKHFHINVSHLLEVIVYDF